METAINIDRLTKVYKLYDKPVDRLKEAINPFRGKYHKDFYALNDISFEVKKGETIGIIGKNGSGKSTLLKIITGILTPSAGQVRIDGRVSALLELGAGFNPEYTGIENIYLNGTIMGYGKEEMEGKLEEIIRFADIGKFIYQPVKTYSSGMFARLAFAVAINVDPDILIVDEALSVGDAFFQNKCFHRFDQFREEGKTVLFVSHDLSSVRQLCSRVLWLDQGRQAAFGGKDEVCGQYLNQQIDEHNKNEFAFANTDMQRSGSANNRITSNLIRDEENYNEHGPGEMDLENKFSIKQSEDNKQRFTDNLNIGVIKIPRLKPKSPPGGTGQVEIFSFFIKDGQDRMVSELLVEKEYTFHFVAGFKADLPQIIFGLTLENNKGIPVLDINSFMINNAMTNGSTINNISVNHRITNNRLDFACKDGVYHAVFRLKIPKMQKGDYLITPAIASGTQNDHIVLCRYHNQEKVTIINDGYNLSLVEWDGAFSVRENLESGWEFSECSS